MRALFDAVSDRSTDRRVRSSSRPCARRTSPHVGDVFAAGGRDVGAALRPLLAVTRGHPQRVMLLARHLWEHTRRTTTADEATFANALDAATEQLGEAFDRTWRGLDDGERRALVAIVASAGRPTTAAGMRAADAARTTLAEALVCLKDAGVVADSGEIVDSLFELWLQRGRPDA